MSAALAYRPGACASDVLLVLAEERAASATEDTERWQSLATGAAVRSRIVRDPPVGALATLIADALVSHPAPIL